MLRGNRAYYLNIQLGQHHLAWAHLNILLGQHYLADWAYLNEHSTKKTLYGLLGSPEHSNTRTTLSG